MTDGPPSDATAPGDDAPRDEVPRDEVPRGEVPREEVPHDEVPHEDVPRDDPAGDGSADDELFPVPPHDETPTEAIAVTPGPAAVDTAPPAGRHAQAPAARPPRDRGRMVARGIGQTLITAGLVVLLFVVYEVYITDIFGHEKQAKATAAMDQRWEQSPAPTVAGSAAGTAPGTGTKVVTVTDPNKLVTNPGTRKRDYRTIDGQGFAKIHVPAFGPDYSFTIIEGTSTDDLYVGPGHYSDSQYPGEQGNFAVAGHRVSKGSPFNELGLLNSCDSVVIETQSDWFVYRVLPMQNEVASWKTTPHAHCAGVAPQTGQYASTFGREITDPSDYAEVLPVPHVEATTVPSNAERLITLTTCHPQFSDAQRMIIHGILVKSYKKAAGFLPPELNES